MHIVIFSGGDFVYSYLAEKVIKDADLIMAADSGADTAVRLNIFPSIVVGDFDSITKKNITLLRQKNTRFISFPQEKNYTDTELAIDYAVIHGATDITMLGGIAGDRVDHIITTLLLAVKSKVPIRFINGNQVSLIANGPQTLIINGKPKDLLSLIPLTPEVSGIETKHLYYSLHNESLFLGKGKGVSNIFTKKDIEIKFSKGTLLIVHTHTK